MQDVLPMPPEVTRPISDVAPGVTGWRIVMVNVYGIRGPSGSWTLIDAGLYFSANRIRRWAEQQFGRGARPASIILTHAHFDHVGSLRELVEHWDVPVYAHPLEMPYLTGQSKYPPPDPLVGGGVYSLLSGAYPRGPINIGERLRPLPGDESVPGLPGWRWIPTPGHSPGHISLFREEDRVLIAGDAFVTTKQESVVAVAQQRPELHGPPAYYTCDWDAAALSVGRLAALEPNVVACGHGLPMVGPEMEDALEYLAEHFDVVARPAHGRYAHRPAITNETGIVALPPPIVSTAQKIAFAAAVAAGVVWLTFSKKGESA